MRVQIARVAWTVLLALVTVAAGAAGASGGWQEEFPIAKCRLLNKGRNPYFVLEPGFQLELKGGGRRLVIKVLDRTRRIGGVDTRAVEEREWEDGKLREVAINYFALCEGTNDVYYFGEDVDMYEGDKVVRHDGSWLADGAGNRAGLIMPGSPKAGMKYYQEIAPGVAMDRAEILSLDGTCKTPAGTFSRCMKIREGSALEPTANDVKYYAPGVGFVSDGTLMLVRHGFGP